MRLLTWISNSSLVWACNKLSYEQNICYSEILVNDIPVNKNFTELVDGGAVIINNYIFKSGLQKVTFRLYPAIKGKDFDLKKF